MHVVLPKLAIFHFQQENDELCAALGSHKYIGVTLEVLKLMCCL